MDNKTPITTNEQEVDLAYLYKSFKNFVDNIGFLVFRMFNFLYRNIIVSLVLVVLGAALGYYLYSTDDKAYKHEVILVPNFGSSTYLYNKIVSVKQKGNSDVLQHVNGLEIEPIVDLFQFVSDNEQNLEIAKYMSENTIVVNKYKKDSDVEKLYKYHKLTFYTDVEDVDNKIFEALLKELNNDAYLKERQKVEVLNAQKKTIETQASIDKINGVFDKLSTVDQNASNKLNVDMYSQVNDLMETKSLLITELSKLKIQEIEQTKIVFDASKSLNIKNKGVLKIIVFPFLFIFLFLSIAYVVKLAKKYKKRYSHLKSIN